MSWFRKTPKAKEIPKHLPHHRVSPLAEKILEETKKTHQPLDKKVGLEGRK